MSEILTPTVYNVTLTTANTEYSQALPAGCKRFEFQTRTADDVLWAFVTGKVAGPTAPYMTLKSGTSYTAPEKVCVASSVTTLYFAGGSDGLIVELVAWN